ncbi:MAG TPA: helix-turn-helix domain-containing protein [Thermoanaerobaculia bacterium]|jgi:DNA-binding Xre family transcriptional regulator|nr:helix-turn-helix domain-containing protein [Thermoanaerobaculia bacterium]
MTTLEGFIRANKIRPSDLAAEAGISRTHLYRLRMGKMNAKVTTAVSIRDACHRLLHRHVRITDVFEM